MKAALASPARPVLNTPAMVARWKATGRPCDVMVDTGMNRLGLTPEQARSGLLDGLAIDTLMSHLACADEPESPMNEAQLFLFRGLRGSIEAQRYSLANSAGVCLGQRYAFSLTRPGLALYGGIPRAEAEGHIRPVARIAAQVLQVRSVPAGASVGYGATFTAPRPMRIAILNLGYADGYLHTFAGNGVARAGDVACRVIGRVSMDLIAIDLGGEDVAEGDWLTVDHDLPAAAEATGLSQYELLTVLGHRYQRRWT
jgi:alanine racemase